MILAASDLHLQPGEFPVFVHDFDAVVRFYKADVVFPGDIYDFLPIGMDSWRTLEGRETVRRFEALFAGAVFLEGNHTPLRWMKEMFSDKAFLAKSCEADGVHFEHGDRLAPDWRFLRRIAPPLVDFLSDHIPVEWRWLYQRLGWTPGKLKDVYGETSEYTSLVEMIHHPYALDAIKHKRTNIIGHTHLSALREYGDKVVLADCGNLAEGTYVQIDGQSITTEKL